MINSINFEELNNIFKQDKEDTLLFAPIFNRRSGKTTNLIKLAKEHNAIYIGSNAEICKIAKKIEPSIIALSPRQALNRDGLYEIDTVFVIDEVEEREINKLKKIFPFIRMFGLVKWEKSPNWMTLYYTETLLNKENELNENERHLKSIFDEHIKNGRVLDIIRDSY